MADANKLNILIVDDDSTALIALEDLLGSLNQNVIKANSGQEALRQILSADFAVIILDVHMPNMDGFETASLIRERERSQTTPIIFLTGVMKSDTYAFKGYSVGAVDYLIKPVVPVVLLSKVKVFIDLAQKTDQLKRVNEQLRDQALQLVAANRENRDLATFSYSVAHDLRAPLRGIAGFNGLLTQECAEALSPVGLSYLAQIEQSTTRMSQLIDDLLELSRVVRAEIQYASVNLSQIAHSVANNLKNTAPQRQVEFRVAQGDPKLLRIALENLLGNAYKYTGKRPQAIIEVDSMATAHDEKVFYVRDNGAGFDMAYAEKLFAPFQRLHAESEFEGTGIGLTIAERIIHRHGGRIWAESAPEQGATFYFTLG